MTRAWPIALSLTIAALAVYGCEDSPDEELSGRLDDYAAGLNEQAAIFCDCWEEAQWESRTKCQEGNGEILPSARRCYDDAFGRDVGASNDWLGCVLPLQSEYNECLNSKLECDDLADSPEACIRDYNTGRETCIDLPQTINRALEDCAG